MQIRSIHAAVVLSALRLCVRVRTRWWVSPTSGSVRFRAGLRLFFSEEAADHFISGVLATACA